MNETLLENLLTPNLLLNSTSNIGVTQPDMVLHKAALRFTNEVAKGFTFRSLSFDS